MLLGLMTAQPVGVLEGRLYSFKPERHKHFQFSRSVVDCFLLLLSSLPDKITKYHMYSGRKATSQETGSQRLFLFFRLRIMKFPAHG